jgi:hypothetical protein
MTNGTMLVDFDLGRLSDSGIRQFLYLLVETQSQSQFSDAVCDALSRERQRRLDGTGPVSLLLRFVAEPDAKRVIANLLAAKTSMQAAARRADEKSREDLAIGTEFISALIAALRREEKDLRAGDAARAVD